MSSYPSAGQPQPSYGSEPGAGQQGEPPAYPSPGYPEQGGYPQVAYPQQGTGQTGYPPPQLGAYPQAGYEGYPQAGYEGYPQAGYEGYPQQFAGYPQTGYPAATGYPYPGYPVQGGPGYPYPGQAAWAADPLVATQVGDWWKKLVGVLSRSWQALLLIQLAVYVPTMVIVVIVSSAIGFSIAGTLATGGEPGGGTLALAFLAILLTGLVVAGITLLGQGASVYAVTKQAANQPVRVGEALSFAARRALPFLGWGALAGVLVQLGTLFFVVPGLYLAVVFAGTLSGVIMFERTGIGRMFELAHKDFWITLGRLLTFWLAAFAYILVIYLVISAVGAAGAASGDPATAVVLGGIVSLIGGILLLAVPFASVGASIVSYASLRNKDNPAVGTHVLVAELDRP